MSEKAECPHCGSYTSNVYYYARCSCGWADPDLHEPREQHVEIDLNADEARAALNDPQALLAEIRKELERPLISMHDHEPVLFQERRFALHYER